MSFFQPKEVKIVLAALEYIEMNIEILGFSSVKKDVKDLIAKGANRTVASIREDGMNPNDLVWLLITNVVDSHISSGRYHIYRGVLSGRGQHLLALWSVAVGKLKESGYYTPEKAAEDMAYISKQISEVG